MNVEVEGGADVGVAEEDADGLIVAFAFDAAGGKTMPQTVKAHFGKAKLLLEFAFINEVIDQMELVPLRDRLHYLVEQRFRGQLSKCEGCKLCR